MRPTGPARVSAICCVALSMLGGTAQAQRAARWPSAVVFSSGGERPGPVFTIPWRMDRRPVPSFTVAPAGGSLSGGTNTLTFTYVGLVAGDSAGQAESVTQTVEISE